MTECLASPAAVIARCAADALREELETYPKPGLVSFVDHGSHPDMDAECFLASIEAIEPFFARMAEAGAEGSGLSVLQETGIAAEAAMLAATGGRNTHRGAIFCLGLLAAAAGRRRVEPASSLGEIVRRYWGPDILPGRDLPALSKGFAACRRYHLGGVRGEAWKGFPSVYERGLPAFRSVAAACGREAARVQAFFALLAVCEDTTLLSRGGSAGWHYGQYEARLFLQNGGVRNPCWLAHAEAIHQSFVQRNLTAGGAADLLAAVVFVDEVERRS